MDEIKHKNVHILHPCGFFRFVVLLNFMSQVKRVQLYYTTTIDNMISNVIEGKFELLKWLSAVLLQVVLT